MMLNLWQTKNCFPRSFSLFILVILLLGGIELWDNWRHKGLHPTVRTSSVKAKILRWGKCEFPHEHWIYVLGSVILSLRTLFTRNKINTFILLYDHFSASRLLYNHSLRSLENVRFLDSHFRRVTKSTRCIFSPFLTLLALFLLLIFTLNFQTNNIFLVSWIQVSHLLVLFDCLLCS